ncbi:MAG: hypothetical protein INQ03_10720 [Candidatus Heimdallarchaeota archaeon]|nr:hypothetical protein [Candidatus Heimdallarchaeota archaeon]
MDKFLINILKIIIYVVIIEREYTYQTSKPLLLHYLGRLDPLNQKEEQIWNSNNDFQLLI